MEIILCNHAMNELLYEVLPRDTQLSLAITVRKTIHGHDVKVRLIFKVPSVVNYARSLKVS